MSLFFLKVLAGFLILCTSIVAGLLPFYARLANKRASFLSTGEALGSGIFLGTALFHMLPSADQSFHLAFNGAITYPYAELVCAGGFVSLLFIEKIAAYLLNLRVTHSGVIIAYLFAFMLSIHAITEGAALGINNNLANTLIIFIAIMVHKGSESFAFANNLHNHHLSFPHMLAIFAIFSLMTPIGIAAGSSLLPLLHTHSGLVTKACINAFTAGTFLYIATLHQINHQHLHEKSAHLSEFIALIVGLGLMAGVAVWV